MMIPRKINIFIWKTYHNGILVGSALLMRLGVSDVKCRFCSYKIDFLIHLFKDYWWLRAPWSDSRPSELHLNIPFSCFADSIFYLSRNLDHKDFLLAACTFWYVWFNRNLR